MFKSILAAASELVMLSGAASAQELSWPNGADEGFTSRDYQNLLHQVTKPGARPATGAGAVAGDDSCRYANDNECDEPGLGTGACLAGTDHSDCWRLMAGVEDDSCQWANDGECDEPGFGTGACTQATPTRRRRTPRSTASAKSRAWAMAPAKSAPIAPIAWAGNVP